MTFNVKAYHPDYTKPINDYDITATSIDEAVAQVIETMGWHHVFEDGCVRVIVEPFGLTYTVEERTW